MDKSEKFWDKQSIKFEKLVDKDEQSFKPILENTRKYLKKTDKLLDFACGIGTSSMHMIEYVNEIQAIDISSGMINIAKKRISELPEKNIDFIHTTLFDEQFKNQSFDIVTAFNILHLLENPKLVIRRIHELLKPGGLFISSSPFLGEKSAIRFFYYLMSKTGMVPHLKLLKIDELKKIMISEHFNIIEIQKSYHPTLIGFMVVTRE